MVGRVTLIKSEEIASVGKSYDNEETYNSTGINVPPEHKNVISRLVEDNSDIFASKDSNLGHTNTIKMKTDTGKEPPIKLKAYKAPIKQPKRH